MTGRGAALRVLAGIVLVALLGGCSLAGSFDAVVAPGAPAPAGSAAQALDRLPVKGRAPKTGYARDRFGESWADVDRNGCDTRNDVLARDLTATTRQGCKVLTGSLHDPYTGATVAFRRGARTSEEVQIDHVVALSNAWQTGAAQLADDERERLANDPLGLLATQGSVNESKRDGDAATWLPPSTGARCGYVARQVAVKTRYRLWVTPPERDAIARILSRCPDQPLPR
ncbi:HNH endonuclease family protein [Pseudonocardia endophytica]|uniref:Uncharacterized protein DUF1524 n=1 Tax=Pseudonocardia endophytica TaxID=401976 RepID=A0A4R1HVN4_PSEEN|nr:HNH endonuclease family protein [Pseudonocardia endophytica]TCK26804.1 uncharacterized protein DUF1524 [Pseudonocardia endophytica]